jgi:tripartite-type tricarboxylate transporter receptor subunit TctC
MQYRCRILTYFAICALGIAAASEEAARSEPYPTQPVHIIAGAPPGGPVDTLARLMGQWLSERLGQPFVIENRPGAGTNLGTELVIRSRPDGSTLLLVPTAAAVNATLYPQLNFDFIRDIAPVAGVARAPLIMVVPPSFPATTVPEFIAYAKANPGKVNMASPGIGTPMHVAAELIKLSADVNMVHVPYRGPAGAFTDLIAGRVQAFIITVPAAIGFIRDGRLVALGVTSAKRAEVLPNVPAIGEFLPGFAATAWDGTCAPKATPSEVIEKLNATINAGLADPNLKAKIKELGGETMSMTPAEFGKFLAEETAKWAKVVKFAGLKPN